MLENVVRVVRKKCAPKIFFCFLQYVIETKNMCNFATMSQFCIYIKLEKYLAEWLTHSLGNPVRFPASSNENAVIRCFLQKLPEDKLPETQQPDEIAICIPDSKAKPASSWNYMGEKGKKAVREAILDLFIRNLWNDLQRLEGSSIGINTRIAAWCEMHGIGIDRVETVRQRYYRIRDAYTKKGINLQNSTRGSSDDNG